MCLDDVHDVTMLAEAPVPAARPGPARAAGAADLALPTAPRRSRPRPKPAATARATPPTARGGACGPRRYTRTMLGGPFGATADVLAYLLLLVVALAVWRLMWRGRRLPGVTRGGALLVGHRGTRGVLPENTVAAFEYALGAGLDGIEFDVQRARDGSLIVTHDTRVDGVAVAELTLPELRERLPGLPTLEAVFAAARAHPGGLLNLEIKAEGARTRGLERAVVGAVLASGLADRTLISSFNPLSLLRVRMLAPRLRVALLYDASSARRLGGRPRPGWLHVDAVHPHHSLVDAGLVRAAHGRGVAVNVWTVTRPEDVRRLRALGVDGIMGDDPEALLRSVRGG